MPIIRIPAADIDPQRDWHVLRPGGGRTVHRFPVHSVTTNENTGITRVEVAQTHFVAEPGDTVLVDRPDIEVDLCAEPEPSPEPGLEL